MKNNTAIEVEVMVESISAPEEIQPVPRVGRNFPLANNGKCVKTEVNLRVTNGKVTIFHSAGFHTCDVEEAAVDAVRRISLYIPRNGKRVLVVFSESAKDALSQATQKEIRRICQNQN